MTYLNRAATNCFVISAAENTIEMELLKENCLTEIEKHLSFLTKYK